MEEIIRQTPSQYIIIRKKGEETEYFSGANIYGRDNDGVLRVSKTTWSKTINPMRAPYNQDKMKDILDGMRKYGEIEEGYNYVIAEIQTTTKIVNYIEQYRKYATEIDAIFNENVAYGCCGGCV